MTEAKMAAETRHVFEIYIKTTPEKLWDALTNGDLTAKYYFGTRVESDWQAGSAYSYNTPDGMKMIDGKVIESDPPNKLVTTFKALWCEEGVAYPESRVTYEITAMGDACKLTLLHEGLVAADPLTQNFFSGWSTILSGLKTYLETGEPLVIAPMKSE